MHLVEVVGLLVALFSIVFAILLVTKKAPSTAETKRSSPLNYDEATSLDAEDLAEGGMRKGYDALLPRLIQYTPQPWDLEERIDADSGTYYVMAGGSEYLIDAPNLDTVTGWGRATAALFSIVNQQLALEQSEYRLYAINGGNDLFGIFLTSQEAEAARHGLSSEQDWPYLPTAPAGTTDAARAPAQT